MKNRKKEKRCNICRKNLNSLYFLEEWKHQELCKLEELLDPVERHNYLCIVCKRDFSVSTKTVTQEETNKRLRHVNNCGSFHGKTSISEVSNPSQVSKNRVEAPKQSVICLSSSDSEIEILDEGYLSEFVEYQKPNNALKYISLKKMVVPEPVKKNNYKQKQGEILKNPPKWKKIQDSEFVVDGFKYFSKKYYFLTHFHSDHYFGLAKKNLTKKHKIVCTPTTSRLLKLKYKIEEQNLIRIEIGQELKIKNYLVKVFDANHCPGACMFCFWNLKSKKLILHVGDFRYDRKIIQLQDIISSFKGCCGVNCVYLDTTYIQKYAFPSQKEALSLASALVLKYFPVSQRRNPTMLIFGSYLIGKEKVLLAVLEALEKEKRIRKNSKVTVEKSKLQVFQSLDIFDLEMVSRITSRNPKCPLKQGIHVRPMGETRLDKLYEIFKTSQVENLRIIAVRPTGWAKVPKVTHHPKNQNITLISIPYSEHSSFRELQLFLSDLKKESGFVPTLVSTVHPKLSHEMLIRKLQ
eukprot:maker-scaffold_49-snap-gene-0.1-mRNA-1 protein AED:0.00 eAED:0.00 QI:45/1/1/1/1/1/2/172/520